MQRPPKFPFLRRFRFAGPLLFVLLVAYVGPTDVLRALSNSHFYLLLAAVGLNVPNVGMKAVRLLLFMRHAGVSCPFRKVFSAYMTSIFIGLLTPGRVGEFVKVAIIGQDVGVPMRKVFPPVLIDRLFDLYLLLGLGLIALFRYSLLTEQTVVAALVVIAFGMSLPFLMGSSTFARWVGSLSQPLRLGAGWAHSIDELSAQFRSYTGVLVLAAGLCTFAAYLLLVVQYDLCAMSLALNIPFFDLALIVAAASFVSLLPISVAGIGVRDVTLVVLLARVGIEQSQALALSVALLVVLPLGCGLIGLVF